MLEAILQYLNNWFIADTESGTYTIENGGIDLPFLREGQYFRIIGSVFNDGLHQYGNMDDELTDETFDGVIWALAIPKSVLSIAEKIQVWQDRYGDVSANPYTSESFGGYSYTKGSNYSNGNDTSWQTKFASELAPYRKIKEMGATAGADSYSDPSYRKPYNPTFPWG